MIRATPPTLTLHNGVEMPALGLGVFQSPPAETAGAVEAAIEVGLPADRQRGRIHERARSRRGDSPFGNRAQRDLRGDEGVDHRLRLGRGAARISTRAPASWASTGSTCCSCITRCRRPSTEPLDAYGALEALLADGKVRAASAAVPTPTASLSRPTA
jgi:hypothetical protein